VTIFHSGETSTGLYPDIEELLGDRDGGLELLAGRRFDAVVDTSGFVPLIVRASAKLLAGSGHYAFVSTECLCGRQPRPALRGRSARHDGRADRRRS
jgi:2'-hydroxyisoflavone reductase